MYPELFQLSAQPFQLTPDPEFLFASPQHARAKAYMESTVLLAEGFVVLTGEIGCGKTTLIESFVSELSDDMVVVQIGQTQLSPVEFLQSLLVELGVEPYQMGKIELLTRLKHLLRDLYASGKRVLLIVDEAQNLSPVVLEEVRMLSGIETHKEKVLRIVLCGQPELAEKLDSPGLEQLAQRVRLRIHISGLSETETGDYIRHRLDVAGASGRAIFSDEALGLVYPYTGGVPRLINILCDAAMLCAFAEDEPTVSEKHMQAAVNDLRWVAHVERVEQRLPVNSSRPDRLRRLDESLSKLDNALEEFRHLTGADASLDQVERLRAPGVPLARLEVMRRGEHLSAHDLPVGRITIGRAPENDLCIDSIYMSRHHAQIITSETQSILEDLNSTNGCRVGGERVQSFRLTDGDLLSFGEHTLLYKDLRRELEQTSAPLSAQQGSERNRATRRNLRETRLVKSTTGQREPKKWRGSDRRPRRK